MTPRPLTLLERPSSTVMPLERGNPSVRRLPKPQPLPLWLKFLVGAQKGITVLTLPVAAIALALYAQTVYTQQLWNRDYHKLETLKRHERQLIAANEALKNQLAQQAERPMTGLVSVTPANTIFLKSAPKTQPSPANHPPEETEPEAIRPMGY
ncbi:hypothetical protein BST81_16040 [Leptolyngbya sp. 'hensonii']|uniref:hypothetical protein n=1 Tax=Leptolyngbya sp. 'hensonii' TaxID=1922337 RepID=UPI00094F552C|nr:hypothetical protein [Leptolyngbya sp. 'hensonii']OLP17317.1 hypothetical protein BST81_16040 [Leptolyngbya sp. 'hensonii']